MDIETSMLIPYEFEIVEIDDKDYLNNDGWFFIYPNIVYILILGWGSRYYFEYIAENDTSENNMIMYCKGKGYTIKVFVLL